jgi:hypothetical protein
MRTIRFVCWLALPVGALLLCGLDGAGAQGVDARQACTPDAMKLCSEFIPDVAKITACMTAKRAELSEACRTAMGGGARAGGHEARRRHARVHRVRHIRHHG